MSFYSSIASWYDLLFPFDEEQFNFLSSTLDPLSCTCPGIRAGNEPVSRQKYLDIGCGTGTMLSAFSDRFKHLCGLDSDPALLALAAKKLLPGEGKKVDLLEGDMANLFSLFHDEEFSFITCLGNTIPHLRNPDSMLQFLKSVRELLALDAWFVFQIIGYDRILDSRERGLPTIERGDVTFERYYSEPKQNGMIDFDTILSDPENDIEIKNSIELFPVRKAQMEEFLSAAGFSHFCFFGDFKAGPWTPDSSLLVGVCS